MQEFLPRDRSAYRRATYVITDPACPMVLRVRTDNQVAAVLLQTRELKSAVFITAHNPGGILLSPQENQQRHAELLDALQPWPLLAGFRASDSGDWPIEPGVLVLCDQPDLQAEWLRRFEQEGAIRISDQGEVELVFNRSRPPTRRLEPVEVLSETQLQALPLFAEFPPHQRLCFYPSSGYQLLWAVMQLDADLFVFSDKERNYSSWAMIRHDFARHRQPLELVSRGADFVQFRSGRKTGVLLWEDNNLVLERLRQAGLQVHHFVGICDGCCEGGNYECVHNRPFVQRLMQVASDGMRYSTDHSGPLQGSYSGRGMLHTRKFLDYLRLDQFPEPEHWTRSGPLPEVDPWEIPRAAFELQGVLIRLDMNGHPRRLEVLPKGRMETTQLDALRPFRTLAGRGRLAEYRVRLGNRPTFDGNPY